MSIQEIKKQLSILQVLAHYGIELGRNNMIACPFHADEKPSMKIYPETNTVYCFAGSCTIDSMDAIDFIMQMEKSTKHEAILKAKELITGTSTTVPKQATTMKEPTKDTAIFSTYHKALKRHKEAQVYCNQRALDWQQLDIGYKSRRTADRWARGCLIFPLRNEQGDIVSLYGRGITGSSHFYQTGRSGLYPCYPSKATRRLILTESVIDAASLEQLAEVTKDYTILAMYGTEGLTKEHIACLKTLPHLEEIIFFLDGDTAGQKAVSVQAAKLHDLLPQVRLMNILPLDDEDVNSLLQSHTPDMMVDMIARRRPLDITPVSSTKVETSLSKASPVATEVAAIVTKTATPKLDTSQAEHIKYTGLAANYYAKGGIKKAFDSLKISLQIVHRGNKMDYRAKLDLYEYSQVDMLASRVSKYLELSVEALKKDLRVFADLLEKHRKTSLAKPKAVTDSKYQKKKVVLSAQANRQTMAFLKAPNLMEHLNEYLGECGIIGEQTNRLFLFCIAFSYKMPDTLHALIQGSSGSGKSRLLKIICKCMPTEDVLCFTRVTESSFYNYPEEFLVHKLIGFEDLDGLKEEAQLAVRELISNKQLVSSTTIKTEQGDLVAIPKVVLGPIGSIACTTKGDLYEDNMSRVFLIWVDESVEQTERILTYQQAVAAGTISKSKEVERQDLLQNTVRLLQPRAVLNPYADAVRLPKEAHKLRRLNELFLFFIKQITLLHQYQRSQDEQGRLLTSIEDVEQAIHIMFDSIVLKVDELDGSLRYFFEQLKSFLQPKGKDYQFTQRQVRQHLRISKTACQNYLNQLLELEYINKVNVGQRNTFHYQITFWDNQEKMRKDIRSQLFEQVNALKKSKNE